MQYCWFHNKSQNFKRLVKQDIKTNKSKLIIYGPVQKASDRMFCNQKEWNKLLLYFKHITNQDTCYLKIIIFTTDLKWHYNFFFQFFRKNITMTYYVLKTNMHLICMFSKAPCSSSKAYEMYNKTETWHMQVLSNSCQILKPQIKSLP